MALTCHLARKNLALSLMKTVMKSCRVTGPTRAKPPEREATAQCPSESQAPSLKSAAEAEPSEFFAFKECQDLFRTRLTEADAQNYSPTDRPAPPCLVASPVGLPRDPVQCPSCARWRANGRARIGRQPKRCAVLLAASLETRLAPANQGRRFIGQCGVTNFCACLQVDKACPLTLVLQARVASRSPSSHSVSQGRNPWYQATHAGEPVSPAAFHDAVALVRLILHDLESTAQARMAEERIGSTPCGG